MEEAGVVAEQLDVAEPLDAFAKSRGELELVGAGVEFVGADPGLLVVRDLDEEVGG